MRVLRLIQSSVLDFVYRCQQAQFRTSGAITLGGAVRTDEESSRQQQKHAEAKEQWLRSALRRVPFWQHGHIHLALHALENRDIPTAYASAMAARELGTSRHARGEALRVLGKCFLQRSAADEALGYFNEAFSLLGHTRFDIIEDQAACYIALGDPARASQVLQQIPQQRLSQAGHAVLKFAEGKKSDKK